MVIDGLRASALGCYGNTVTRTPNFDDFASRAALVEWLWADAPQIESFYRSVRYGSHALRAPSFTANLPSLSDSLRDQGLALRLITDDPTLTERFPADELLVVEPPECSEASDVLETGFAQFCGKAIEQLEDWHNDGAGSVTWIHSRGLLGAWDAPQQLRADLLEEDDPEALDLVEPPQEILTGDDPDQLLLYRTAYAAQVAVIDSCFGALWHSIADLMSDREALMMLTGSRGFSLGEHGELGYDVCRLRSERIHLPWLLHVCDDEVPRPRLSELAQPADIHATLLDWLGFAGATGTDGQSVLPGLENEPVAQRDVAVAIGENGQRALVTPAWMFCQDSTSPAELFTKPDDRWEHNDVAIRCPEEVQQLSEVLAGFEESAQTCQPLPTTLADTDLVRPVR